MLWEVIVGAPSDRVPLEFLLLRVVHTEPPATGQCQSYQQEGKDARPEGRAQTAVPGSWATVAGATGAVCAVVTTSQAL